jgi:hypothetical protein
VPIPGSIETLLASPTFQRSVADWPRSMVLGSAKKETLGALGGGGGGASTLGGGGGGGGGGGAFFLQPATVKNRDNASNKTLTFRLLILNFASCGSGKLDASLCPYLPHTGIVF